MNITSALALAPHKPVLSEVATLLGGILGGMGFSGVASKVSLGDVVDTLSGRSPAPEWARTIAKVLINLDQKIPGSTAQLTSLMVSWFTNAGVAPDRLVPAAAAAAKVLGYKTSVVSLDDVPNFVLELATNLSTEHEEPFFTWM